MPCALDLLPIMDYAAGMVRTVAAVVLDGVSPFELGIVCEVFGTDRRADGFPAYEFTLCSTGGGPIRDRKSVV